MVESNCFSWLKISCFQFILIWRTVLIRKSEGIWLFCFCMSDGSCVAQKQMCQKIGRGIWKSCQSSIYLVVILRISYNSFICLLKVNILLSKQTLLHTFIQFYFLFKLFKDHQTDSGYSLIYRYFKNLLIISHQGSTAGTRKEL